LEAMHAVAHHSPGMLQGFATNCFYRLKGIST